MICKLQRNQLENSELRKSSFEKIYTNKIWTDVKDPNDDTPLSGDGSRIDTARPAMKGLVAVLLALHSKSQRRVRLLDAACGLVPGPVALLSNWVALGWQ